jgi:Xaa-Pro dipeptidase
MYQERVNQVLSKMETLNQTQLVVSDPMTIYYLTGKMIDPGERLVALIFKANGEHVAVINRLFPVLESEINMPIVAVDDTDEGKGIAILANQLNHEEEIGIDKYWTAEFLLGLMKQVGKGYSHSLGLTEVEMAERLGDIYEDLGNSGFSFDPIVAYGANGADPHHMNDESTVKKGDSIILDIGGVKNGYCSDMTRTFFYQEVPEKSREVYETVLEANKRAIAKVKPGVTFAEIDAAARDYITEKGYGKYFTHRTGHFIGMECHEAGDVSAINHKKVQPGMIFSIEPGIYVPGEVGVRIEDLVVATEDGCELLNHYPKELTVLG